MSDKKFGSIEVNSCFSFTDGKKAMVAFEIRYEPESLESVSKFEQDILDAAAYLVKMYRSIQENSQCKRLNELLAKSRAENKAAAGMLPQT